MSDPGPLGLTGGCLRPTQMHSPSSHGLGTWGEGLLGCWGCPGHRTHAPTHPFSNS